MTIILQPVPLTPERFAPYGEVIQSARQVGGEMNAARFERFDKLCDVDVAGAPVSVSIARCRTPTALPLKVDMVERHPLGSQAFIPLTPAKMIVVVAPPGESVDAESLRAFVTNGRQGFNYRRGTWHMPLIAFESGQEFLVIDYGGEKPNYEEHYLDRPVLLHDDVAR